MGNLPWICKEHPEAQIRHEWDRTRTRFHLTGAEIAHDEPDSHRYYCNECGKELAPPESVIHDKE